MDGKLLARPFFVYHNKPRLYPTQILIGMAAAADSMFITKNYHHAIVKIFNKFTAIFTRTLKKSPSLHYSTPESIQLMQHPYTYETE